MQRIFVSSVADSNDVAEMSQPQLLAWNDVATRLADVICSRSSTNATARSTA